MKIIRAKDYADMSRKAANIISAQIIMKPDCTLGLATGSTPIGIYVQLVERYQEGDLDFSKVRTINLDEYRGIPKEHPQSYYYYMQEKLFSKVNLSARHTFIPDGMEQDVSKACADYNAVIESLGGIDLQLLGLGHNGHIGFNEPGEVFEKETHCVRLSESTINANSRFFAEPDAVPKEAYTMGVGQIMQAKKVIVAVSGKDKAKIVKEAFFGAVTTRVPASILQFHNDLTVIGDEEALSAI